MATAENTTKLPIDPHAVAQAKQIAKAMAAEMAGRPGGPWVVHLDHPAGFTLFIARSRDAR